MSIDIQMKQNNRPFATTVSQLKMCDFSGENSKSFKVLYN
jgi:hypothetical protein